MTEQKARPDGEAEDWRSYSERLGNEEFPGLPLGTLTESAPATTPEGTALIKVNPGANPEVAKLHQEVVALLVEANALVITDASQLRPTTDTLAMMKGLKTALQDVRTSYTQPINEHLRDVSAEFHVIMDPLEEADKTTRRKVVVFREQQEAIRKEEERINALRQEASRAEMVLKDELSEPTRAVEVQPALHNRSMTGMGSAGMRSNWKWEVQDITQVPTEHLMVDASKVTRLVKAGLHSIPGLRIWDEKGLSVSVNKG